MEWNGRYFKFQEKKRLFLIDGWININEKGIVVI